MSRPEGQVVLAVRDLRVTFSTDDGSVTAVDGVSFDLHRGETLGVVGESGSGKSVTSMAILGLLPRKAQRSGSVRLRGVELLDRPERELERVRGKDIAMVFQDALTALNPVQTVGDQIEEALAVHDGGTPTTPRRQRVEELLALVGIPDPARRARQHPHEYSGGMRQRAMIAMAIANDPDVLIADEPTTALDVTIQAQVLEVFGRVQERTDSSIVLITHDLGVVAGVADRVLVMYAGRPVEIGTVEDVFYRPAHPYTRGLLASLPRIDDRRGARLHRIEGHPPSLLALPPGCSFHPRCPHRVPGRCDVDRPELEPVSIEPVPRERGDHDPVPSEPGDEDPTSGGGAAVGAGHAAACHFAGLLAAEGPPTDAGEEVGAALGPDPDVAPATDPVVPPAAHPRAHRPTRGGAPW